MWLYRSAPDSHVKLLTKVLSHQASRGHSGPGPGRPKPLNLHNLALIGGAVDASKKR
jgi:hypothetical protein